MWARPSVRSMQRFRRFPFHGLDVADEFPAQLDRSSATPVRKEPKVTNAHEPAGKYMQQKATQELIRGNRHLPLFVAVRIIFPAESDLVAIKAGEAMIADGHTMRVPSQIMQDVFRSTEWRFGIHHPLFPG